MRFFTDRNLIEFENNFQITYYATCIFIGIVLALFLAIREGRKLGISKQFILDGVLICVPLAILGARLYYVLFELKSFHSLAQVFGLESGGLAGLSIIGGIIVAIIFVIIYGKINKVNYFKIFEILAPGLLVGQICGRWGNFFNQEAFGGEINNISLMYKIIPDFIMDKMFIEGAYRHPTFLYESLWNIVGLLLILILRNKFKKMRIGDSIGIYLIWYGIGRGLLIEPFRTDALMFYSIRINVLVPLLFALGGIIYLILKHKNILKQPYYHEVVTNVSEQRIQNVVFSLDDMINANHLYQESIMDLLTINKIEFSKEKLELQINSNSLSELLVIYNLDYSSSIQNIKNFLDQINEFYEIKHNLVNVVKKFVKSGLTCAINSHYELEITRHFLHKIKLDDFISIIINKNDEKEALNKVVEYFPNIAQLLIVSKDVSYLKIAQEKSLKIAYMTSKDKSDNTLIPNFFIYKTNELYDII